MPSFAGAGEVKLKLGKRELSYTSENSWFQCSMFDEFLSRLIQIKKGIITYADFTDMDGDILYRVSTESVTIHVNSEFGELGVGFMKFEIGYSSEVIGQHIEILESFPKWW